MNKDKMMKNIMVPIIGLLVLVFLSIAGLYAIKYTSSIEHNKLIHIDTANQSRCITAVNLYKEQNGIKVETKEFGELYLSDGTYIIIDSGVCPYCETETTD